MIKIKIILQRFAITLILSILLISNVSNGQKPEYLLKAVFLEKISKFIDWPDSSEIQHGKIDTFTILIYGDDPFDGKLEAIFEKRQIKEKDVKIIYSNSIQLKDDVHMVFIPKNEHGDLEKLDKFTKNKPILIIGDSPKFPENIAHIYFYIENSKLRFDIVDARFGTSGLSYDYRLRKVKK